MIAENVLYPHQRAVAYSTVIQLDGDALVRDLAETLLLLGRRRQN